MKRRIQEKIKTEATNEDINFILPINNHFGHIKKPKSKIFVSTLQLVIDPLLRKTTED